MTKEKTPPPLIIRPDIQFSSPVVFVLLGGGDATRVSFYPDPKDEDSLHVHKEMYENINLKEQTDETKHFYRFNLHFDESYSLMTLITHSKDNKRGVFKCSNKGMIDRFMEYNHG
jgi:hypothetical protein